jgi:hypothetical protein
MLLQQRQHTHGGSKLSQCAGQGLRLNCKGVWALEAVVGWVQVGCNLQALRLKVVEGVGGCVCISVLCLRWLLSPVTDQCQDMVGTRGVRGCQWSALRCMCATHIQCMRWGLLKSSGAAAQCAASGVGHLTP